MSNIPSKLHRACDCYGKGKLISQYRFYELVKAGRVRLYHLGPGGSYSAETDIEIILRIDREDAECRAVDAGRCADRVSA
jgi:hypothetical protein